MEKQVKIEEPDEFSPVETKPEHLIVTNSKRKPYKSRDQKYPPLDPHLVLQSLTNDMFRTPAQAAPPPRPPNATKRTGRKPKLLSKEEVEQLNRLMKDPPVKAKQFRSSLPNMLRSTPYFFRAEVLRGTEQANVCIRQVDERQINAEHAIKQFFKEAKIPIEAANLLSFQELVRHLNPMMNFSDLVKQEEIAKQKHLVSTARESTSVSNYVPKCIICSKSAPTHKTLTLSVNEAIKILIAGIEHGTFKLHVCEKKILQPTLKMCKNHISFCYVMMSKALGATCVYDLEKGSTQKILKLFETFKHLRFIRDTADRKKPVNTPIGAFKRMIRMFFEAYTPRNVLMKARGQPIRVIRVIPFNGNPISKKPLPSKPEAKQDTVSTTVQPKKDNGKPVDLFYQSIEERRINARNQRYAQYPAELRAKMQSVDDAYEEKSQSIRTQMVEIRQNKKPEPYSAPPLKPLPKRRKRAAPMDFVRLAQSVLYGSSDSTDHNSSNRPTTTKDLCLASTSRAASTTTATSNTRKKPTTSSPKKNEQPLCPVRRYTRRPTVPEKTIAEWNKKLNGGKSAGPTPAPSAKDITTPAVLSIMPPPRKKPLTMILEEKPEFLIQQP